MNASTILMIIEIIKLIQALQASQDPKVSKEVTSQLVESAVDGSKEEKTAIVKGLAEIDIVGFISRLLGKK